MCITRARYSHNLASLHLGYDYCVTNAFARNTDTNMQFRDVDKGIVKGTGDDDLATNKRWLLHQATYMWKLSVQHTKFH